MSWLDEMYDLAARFPDIREAHVTQFRADPLPVQKGARVKLVGRIFLKMQTADSRHVDALQSAMHAEPSATAAAQLVIRSR